MIRYQICLTLVLLVVSCSGRGSGPLAPPLPDSVNVTASCSSHPYLWGLWNIEYDPDSEQLFLLPMRTSHMTVNVTQFLQPPAGSTANIGITILDKSTFKTDGRMDLRVTLTHPFSIPKLRGFDVRGVVMGNAAIQDSYNTDIRYAGANDLRLLNADGYTRWFNAPEFQTKGLFGFTPGALGTKGFSPTATINGYKYFAEMIQPGQTVFDYFASSPAFVTNRGSMTPGSSLSRDYFLKFPVSPLQVKFQYAVIASWEKATAGGDYPAPKDFPQNANAFEPIALSVVDTSDLYYEDEIDKGGNIRLRLSIVDWWAHFDFGNLENHVSKIIVSSPNIDMPGGSFKVFNYSERPHYPSSAVNAEAVDIIIPGCAPSGTENQHVLIAVEMSGHDYTNPFGQTNSAWNDPLTGYFVHTFSISTDFNDPPVVTSGVSGPSDVFIMDTADYTVSASDPDSPALSYEWTIRDPLMGTVLYGPEPGDGAGLWTVDWADADLPGSVEIWCEVSDGEKTAQADPLEVTVGDLIFHANMNDTTTGDNAGWTTNAGIGISKWTTTAGQDNVLKGYGRKFGPFLAQYLVDSADILVSPAINIPSAVERAIMVVSHSYDFEYYAQYEVGFDGGNIKITKAPALPVYTDPEQPILAGKQYDGWLFDTAINDQMAFASDQFKNMLLVSAVEIPPAFLGSSIHLGFAAATNYFDYAGNHGWLIDDVQIRAMPSDGNAPPMPSGPVTGDDRALLLSDYPAHYQVVGYDLEDDPLSYVWLVKEPGTGTVLWGPQTGPTSGELQLDWTQVVSSGGNYEVHAVIYDSWHAGVPAPPLTVLVQQTIFHADFSDTTTGGNAGWSAILESGQTSWTTETGSDPFLKGFGYKWGDFGEPYKENSQGILLSPAISIPPGISSASIYILHDFQFLPALDGGNIKVTVAPTTPTFSTKEETIDGGWKYDVKLVGTVMNNQNAFGIGAGGGTLMMSRIDLPASMFGHQIRIGFAVASGTTFFNQRGWLIDDVAIATIP